MAILSTGNEFGPTDTVTSTKLNNIADAATFADPVDDSTLELHTDGKLRIKNGGVTFAKLTDVIDDDTMATASATTLATSESIKAYVDDNGITQTSGTAPYYGVRAFGAFDGSTTPPTIIASGNVTSVTRLSTGLFEVTLTTAMPDGTNYAVVSNEDHHIGSNYETSTTVDIQSSSAFHLLTGGSGGLFNSRYVGFMVIA
jgi:hypothetical protein